MAEIEAKIEYGNLKKLVKAMSKQFSVKVGVLANKTGKGGAKGSDNVSENMDIAGIGAVQEFGAAINVTPKMKEFLRHEFGINLKKTTTQIVIPPRSWLLMPLTKDKGKGIRKKLTAHLPKDDVVEYITESGDLMSLAVMLGAAAVDQIEDAFDTGGFGDWAQNSPITIAQKKSDKPLIDKGRLRGAVAYEVEQNG